MPRRRVEAAQMGSVPSSVSSGSLSSSFSSSAGESTLLPAAPPSNSSQSDIVTPDHSVHSSSSKVFFPQGAINPAPRSSSLPSSMGQILSRPLPAIATASPPPSPSKGSSHSASSRLKRVFAGRRKKPEDVSLAFAAAQAPKTKGKERLQTESSVRPQNSPAAVGKPRPIYAPRPSYSSTPVNGPPIPSLSSPDSAGIPPTPPPKPMYMQAPLKAQLSLASAPPRVDQRSSFAITSPSIAAALEYISENERTDVTPSAVARPAHEKKDQELEKIKEEWRKSDATTTSYHTVRPRSTTSAGTRTPRPVSMAESLHSTHTIVPANKRLSALITEAEFTMAEEEDSVESGYTSSPSPPSLSRINSPSGSTNARKRHSISLHFTAPTSFDAPPLPPAHPNSNSGHGHYSINPPRPKPLATTAKSDTPTLTRAAANGIIAPSRSAESSQSTGSHIKGRLAAWTAASAPTSPPRQARPLPEASSYPPHLHDALPPRPTRQTAVSMTNGLAPAAGFAVGFGKRAVEKMGRAWGNLSSSHHNSHSHSSSSAAKSGPSAFPNNVADNVLGRTASNQSSSSNLANLASTPAHLGKGKQRRTPNAPSGSWSISSSATTSSVSDSDAFGYSQGSNFGRRFAWTSTLGWLWRACCWRFGLWQGLATTSPDELEKRLLPALVVRCAQHLLKWGVEEEGLFRISGRASHIAKLRAEFDTGSDYDMTECAPGDLDPHAVSSIFKAYLRELPEPILTNALNPYFEAAMIAENNVRKSEDSAHSHSPGSRGPGLPSGPRDGPPLRKPPSLSTLALPNFSGMRPPSPALIAAFTSLIARLPQENRDLLRTLTELINATAWRKETRMPLSNLTLIFCPSLNMSPPVLRVLCEVDSIWNGPPSSSEEVVLDIRNENDGVLDISAQDHEDVDEADTVQEAAGGIDGSQEQPSEVQSSPKPDDPNEADSVNVLAEEELGVDAPAQGDISPIAESARTSSTDDSASFTSAVERRLSTPRSGASPLYNPYSPTPQSSSAESLVTPSTSSEGPSFSQSSLTHHGQNQPMLKPMQSSPVIAELDPASLIPSIHRISASITFPSSDSIPGTPISARTRSTSPLCRLRSLTGLCPPWIRQRSISSLRSSKVLPTTPHDVALPTPSSRFSTPISPTSSRTPSSPLSGATSMVTAPSSSTFELSPVLNMDLETSPMSLMFGTEGKNAESSGNGENTAGLSAPVSRDRSASPRPIITTLPPSPRLPSTSPLSSATLIAERDVPLAMMPAFAPPPVLRPKASTASFASTSTYNRLSLWDEDDDVAPEDDWAANVLMAAETGWVATLGARGRTHP
ncbi:hypothetical protein EW146_g6972 [Bondarzewia mesenterica]|uniref:Rho-GAP domain-containing protein n=1 Tax=Bondarzewia mesenterica TaxID=1095465 RepID=A0A4S4LM15_9AGAM|nr:hypothetical protein EW146_g6972 [Bondarzewia mesenterica]